MTPVEQPAVRAYLDELRRLLAGAPDGDLVVDGVERHIEDALAGAPADPGRTAAVLAELGDPAAIAAEVGPVSAPAAPIAPAVPFLERRGGAVLTVLLLTVGGIVFPVAGWLVGLGLLWFSKGWRLVDKLVGTFTIPVVLVLIVLIGDLWRAPMHLLLLGALPVLDIAIAVLLLLRFRARG